MTDELPLPGHPDPGNVDEAIRIVGAGATNLISEGDLRKKLARGTPLRVKLGIDPTASDIHLGFAVDTCSVTRLDHLSHGTAGAAWRIVAVNQHPTSLTR